jgi:hypothetical protein
MHNEISQFRAALELAQQAAEEAGGQPPCTNAPDLWFDAGVHKETGVDAFPVEEYWEKAKRLCLSCEILIQCRTYAIKYNEPYGVWGATTPRERNRINKMLRRQNK